jgi:O-antigen/teichoic acid export membrane protein
MGVEFSRHAAVSLSLLALSFALLAFNIPGHYALMALGRVRFLAGLNLVGGIVSLLVALALIPHLGIVGAAIGRVTYGPITWLLYPKLRSVLREKQIVGAAVVS